MNNNDLLKVKKYCHEFGLTPNEAKFYLSSLKLGPSTVQKIAKEMRIHRPSAYHLLERLSQNGLVAQEVKRHGRIVIPEPPTRLLNLIRNERNKMRRHELDLEESMPSLMGLFKQSQFNPTFKLYEGVEGLKAIHEDILLTGQTMYCYPQLDIACDVLPKEFQLDFVRRRIQKGIQAKGIAKDCPEAKEIVSHTSSKQYPTGLREMRLLPKGFGLEAEKIIYGNKVAYLSYQKKITGVVIEHEEMATMERQLFELLWPQMRPYVYED